MTFCFLVEQLSQLETDSEVRCGCQRVLGEGPKGLSHQCPASRCELDRSIPLSSNFRDTKNFRILFTRRQLKVNPANIGQSWTQKGLQHEFGLPQTMPVLAAPPHSIQRQRSQGKRLWSSTEVPIGRTCLPQLASEDHLLWRLSMGARAALRAAAAEAGVRKEVKTRAINRRWSPRSLAGQSQLEKSWEGKTRGKKGRKNRCCLDFMAKGISTC